MEYIYLHGFASSPESTKAQAFRDRFAQFKITLKIPDLNQGDFSSLTLTRQIEQVTKMLTSAPVTLIGSSFGGLTAAWVAQRHSQIERLVLMAPAFSFLSNWLPRISQTQLFQWLETGYMPVYHYGYKQTLNISYDFITDLLQYSESRLQRSVPTLIFHGDNDLVIPIQASKNYAQQRPWVKLIELKSDHALTDKLPEIWQNFVSWSSIGLIP